MAAVAPGLEQPSRGAWTVHRLTLQNNRGVYWFMWHLDPGPRAIAPAARGLAPSLHGCQPFLSYIIVLGLDLKQHACMSSWPINSYIRTWIFVILIKLDRYLEIVKDHITLISCCPLIYWELRPVIFTCIWLPSWSFEQRPHGISMLKTIRLAREEGRRTYNSENCRLTHGIWKFFVGH